MKCWRFRTRNFLVTYTTEDEPFDGRSFEPSLKQECRTKINSGEWKCFTAIITVIHRATETELGTAYLGQCIYANRKEFRDHIGLNEKSRRDGRNYGSYFTQMVSEAIADARRELSRLREKQTKHSLDLAKGELRC